MFGRCLFFVAFTTKKYKIRFIKDEKRDEMIDILRDIGVIARSLDSIANIEFKDLNLTRGQYLYLVRIKENSGIIPDNLSEMIKVDRTTASRAIQKLERSGLIEKRADSVNKKIKRLFTTEIGRAHV